MKNIVFLILIFTSNLVGAQVFKASDHYPIKDGKIVFERIDSVSSDKSQLFKNSKKWIVENFRSPKSSIQSEDPIQGQILGMGVEMVKFGILTHQVKYNYQIDVKDKKYRFRIYNLILIVGDISTNLNDIVGESSRNLSAKRYATSAENAKEFRSYFDGILDRFNKSVKNSAEDEF